MNSSRRVAVTAAAVALSFLGTVGIASASSYDQHSSRSYDRDECIPKNDHASPDLYRYPDCPGRRDSRDETGNSEGREERGPFGNFFNF